MRYFIALIGLGLLLLGRFSLAMEHHQEHNKTPSHDMSIVFHTLPKHLSVNTPFTLHFQLLQNHKALGLSQLNEVHTKKIHVLVIDASLQDYHHLHPVMDTKSKTFIVHFTPKKPGSYQMWVDITPLKTKQQTFLMAHLGSEGNIEPITGKQVLNTTLSPYQFKLHLDGTPSPDQEIMANILVSKNGKPYTKLEPIMGAFAHLVGFYGDHATMVHVHPMGKVPSKQHPRGGPSLMFHLMFQKPGFVKLFAQFRIAGHDVYVPFSIWVHEVHDSNPATSS